MYFRFTMSTSISLALVFLTFEGLRSLSELIRVGLTGVAGMKEPDVMGSDGLEKLQLLEMVVERPSVLMTLSESSSFSFAEEDGLLEL